MEDKIFDISDYDLEKQIKYLSIISEQISDFLDKYSDDENND